jgi:hypothetical protein
MTTKSERLEDEVEYLENRVANLIRERDEVIGEAKARQRQTLRECARADSAQAKAARYQAALERIATGKRPDGTYNLSREACEQIARVTLYAEPAHQASTASTSLRGST